MTTDPKAAVTLKVGDRIRDNDPRMKNRILRVVAIEGRYAVVKNSAIAWPRDINVRIDRIHTDYKPRRSGFSLIREDV